VALPGAKFAVCDCILLVLLGQKEEEEISQIRCEGVHSLKRRCEPARIITGPPTRGGSIVLLSSVCRRRL